jgi:hypothetical protein
MLLAALVSGAVACGSRGSDRPRTDAAASPDAAADTGGVRDAGENRDRGPLDAGSPDGGPTSDARPPDAPAPDAAAMDAARPDAGSGGPGDARDGGAPPAPGAYSAAIIHGAYDRLVIVKSDPVRSLCFRLTLVANDTESALPLQLPATWRVESAGASAVPGPCEASAQPAPTIVGATSGSGSVGWSGALPCSVDVDVVLGFSASGLPGQEILRVGAVLPSGC